MLIRRLARPLLATAFVVDGVDTLMHPEPRAKAASALVSQGEQKLPEQVAAKLPSDPGKVVRINAAAQVGAGVLLALGRAPRLSALVLAATVVPATVTEQDFWNEPDPARRDAKRVAFLKDLGLLGGLMIAAADTEGKPSLGWRGRRAARRAAAALPFGASASDTLRDRLAQQATRGRELAEVAAEKGAELVETVQDRGPDWAETVKQRGAHLVEIAQDRGPELAEAAKKRGAHLVEIAQDRGPELADAAKKRGAHLVEIAQDRGPELAETARKRAAQLAERAQERGSEFADRASARGSELADVAADRGSELTGRARRRATKLADKAEARAAKLAEIAEEAQARSAELAQQAQARGAKLADKGQARLRR
ncbi:DoxX family membrane protein [Nocardia pseudobrasiliensis]|uniref:Putative membrane protein YphA (DoxX/SURF4 family) n=1 Tax=Nocardia pseudobrasiliensis TaxID=45979 RepID=A0A370IAU3_9NOCA|nr:DoxX family protein [Nocardia pseudobrasiliensis]RDI67818.1 putative membrane protein YphA (DoxX/SURF4 family) [Nocardia pseudobrasiliensis]